MLSVLQKDFEQPIKQWNGDESDVRQLLKEPTSTKLKNLIGKAKTLLIDEAQRIENIGLTIFLENYPTTRN